MYNYKIKYDEDGRILLDSRIIVLSLLDKLLKEEIIDVKTCIQAKNEILSDIKSNNNS